MSTHIQGLLDVRDFTDMAGLGRAAAALRSVATHESEKPKVKKDMSGIKCYKCHQFGHRSFECRNKQELNIPIVCFTCNEVRHKSTNCPNKVVSSVVTTKPKETSIVTWLPVVEIVVSKEIKLIVGLS